jgi:hypothetical protein
MQRFVEWLLEKSFADYHPHLGQWTALPVSDLVHAQHEPPSNIDTELFDLLNKSYAYIGGHVDFHSASDLPANHTIWYAIDVDGDTVPDAVKFGKQTPFGMKWTGGATNGTPVAKQAYITNTVEMLTTPGNYIEASDAIAHILMTRYRIPFVHTQTEVERIIGKAVRWIGAHPEQKYPGYTGFYVRSLAGQDHMKILLGRPRV